MNNIKLINIQKQEYKDILIKNGLTDENSNNIVINYLLNIR